MGLKPRIPAYCHHRKTGRAFVKIEGHWIYLGKFGSPESQAEYRRVIAEWLATGRVPVAAQKGSEDYTLPDLVYDFLHDPMNHYEKNGKPTSENELLRVAFRHLLKDHSHVPVIKFGPLSFRTVITAMENTDLSRTTINKYRSRILRLFKWGASHELIPSSVYEALRTVPGLRKGRTKAKESEKVRPVPDAEINAILPFLSPEVRTMVELQRFTGMRPGEVTIVRMMDIERHGPVVDGVRLWVYVRDSHKLDHLEVVERRIHLGPRAQTVLQPYFKADPEAYLFSPANVEQQRRERSRAARKTPLTPSQRRRDEKRAANPRRTFRSPPIAVPSTGHVTAQECHAGLPTGSGTTPLPQSGGNVGLRQHLP